MIQEQKFNVHDAFKSIKGINTLLEDKEIMFMKNIWILNKSQDLLTLTTHPISALAKKE